MSAPPASATAAAGRFPQAEVQDTSNSAVSCRAAHVWPRERVQALTGTEMIENLFRPTHLIIVLAIALLVFGPKNLPALGKGLGEAIRSFKDGFGGHDDDASKK